VVPFREGGERGERKEKKKGNRVKFWPVEIKPE